MTERTRLAPDRRTLTNEKTPRRDERGALKASGPRSAVYAALAANFPRSVFTNRASFPFSLISLSIAE